jgi:SAM-dependent methyltransferase
VSAWHEDDAFWETFGPYIFTDDRLKLAPSEVDSLIALLELEPGAKILDLCCGPGRHALEFACRGYAVTGVDRTRSYLDRARNQAASEGLKIELVESDARAFARPDAFDAALNLFTSFGYFDDPADDLKVARNLCASLRAGGKAVVDILGKEPLARRFRERDWSQQPDGTIVLEERKIKGAWERIESRWILVRSDGTKTEGTILLRLYSGTELTALLKQAGFAAVDLYGSVAGSPYDNRAERLIAVARK